MDKQRFQFSIRAMLWATFWVGVWLMTLRLFDVAHFLDDDPDHVMPRIVAAFWAVPAAGAIGSLCGRPMAWAKTALLVWVPVSALIFLVAILPGLL
jgi:hypothetical protein